MYWYVKRIVLSQKWVATAPFDQSEVVETLLWENAKRKS